MREGGAHTALVFDGETAVGWCEYGSPEKLPGIFHRKEVESAGTPLPDYWLTCFFVDRRARGKGVNISTSDGVVGIVRNRNRTRDEPRSAERDRCVKMRAVVPDDSNSRRPPKGGTLLTGRLASG